MSVTQSTDLVFPLYVNGEFYDEMSIKYCPTMFQRFKQGLVAVLNKVDKNKKHSLYTLKKQEVIIECENDKAYQGAHMLEQAMRFKVKCVRMNIREKPVKSVQST